MYPRQLQVDVHQGLFTILNAFIITASSTLMDRSLRYMNPLTSNSERPMWSLLTHTLSHTISNAMRIWS